MIQYGQMNSIIRTRFFSLFLTWSLDWTSNNPEPTLLLLSVVSAIFQPISEFQISIFSNPYRPRNSYSLRNLQKFIQYQHFFLFSSKFFTRLTTLSDMMDPFFIFYLIQGSLIIQLGWTLPISIQLGLKTS